MGLFSDLLKEVVTAMLNEANAANSPAVQKNPQSDNQTAVDSFQVDHSRYCQWCEISNKDTRTKAIVEYLLTLSDTSYKRLLANLEQMKKNIISHIEQHEANEKYAWGRYIEDQMAYQSAKLSSGARDPKWVATMNEYKQSFETVSWTIEVCNSVWAAIENNGNSQKK